MDFVLPGPRGRCDVIECKWQAASHSSNALVALRALHPRGDNFVITPQAEPPYLRQAADLPIVVCNLEHWESGEAQRVARARR